MRDNKSTATIVRRSHLLMLVALFQLTGGATGIPSCSRAVGLVQQLMFHALAKLAIPPTDSNIESKLQQCD